MGRTLFIIDPQIDFMDLPGSSLPVPGATADMNRLIRFIEQNGDKIDRIVIPLDQHPPNHIAHGVMWVNAEGRHPDPFTIIDEGGPWHASNPELEREQMSYLPAIKAAGEVLCIWPPHCIIGTRGYTIYEPLLDALGRWWSPTPRIHMFPKSGYWGSEQYSSFKAAVPVDSEPSTWWNDKMFEAIDDDEIYVAGEALGHCVAASVRDAGNLAERMTLLLDCTSNVAGFEKRAEEFYADFRARGGKGALSTEVTFGL